MAPLIPLPANNTDRYFLEYTSRGIPHTMMFRVADAVTTTEATIAIDQVVEEIRTLMLTTDSFTGLRRSAKGSLISLPIPFTPVFGTQSPTAGEEDPESYFYSVVGRDVSEGRRTAYYFYASRAGNARPNKNRYPAGENAEIDLFYQAIVDHSLNGAAATHFVAVNEQEVVINGYTNVANNAYWQRKQRRA